RAAGVSREKLVQLGAESRIFASGVPGLFELFERRHQHFGGITPAVRAEVSACVGLRSHERRAASINCFMRAWSLRPGDDSTPEATSTAQGFLRSMAARTLPGSRPPARMRGRVKCAV